MDDDVYVIINQENNTIIVYYLNLEDVATISNFTRLQQQYYGDKMILQPIESLGPSETFDMYKKLSEKHLEGCKFRKVAEFLFNSSITLRFQSSNIMVRCFKRIYCFKNGILFNTLI